MAVFLEFGDLVFPISIPMGTQFFLMLRGSWTLFFNHFNQNGLRKFPSQYGLRKFSHRRDSLLQGLCFFRVFGGFTLMHRGCRDDFLTSFCIEFLNFATLLPIGSLNFFGFE